MKASGSHIANCMGPGGLKNTQDTPAYMPQVPREWRREYTGHFLSLSISL